MRRQIDMLCVVSRGNWNNGTNAGVRNRNLNNNRTNANSNVGFADSEPCMPNAAPAVRLRGICRRGLRRNVLQQRLLVGAAAHVGCPTPKTGPAALIPKEAA